MKRIFKIKKDMGFTEAQEKVIYEAMEFLEYFFDDKKYFYKDVTLFKKNYKIIVEIKLDKLLNHKNKSRLNHNRLLR